MNQDVYKLTRFFLFLLFPTRGGLPSTGIVLPNPPLSCTFPVDSVKTVTFVYLRLRSWFVLSPFSYTPIESAWLPTLTVIIRFPFHQSASFIHMLFVEFYKVYFCRCIYILSIPWNGSLCQVMLCTFNILRYCDACACSYGQLCTLIYFRKELCLYDFSVHFWCNDLPVPCLLSFQDVLKGSMVKFAKLLAPNCSSVVPFDNYWNIEQCHVCLGSLYILPRFQSVPKLFKYATGFNSGISVFNSNVQNVYHFIYKCFD